MAKECDQYCIVIKRRKYRCWAEEKLFFFHSEGWEELSLMALLHVTLNEFLHLENFAVKNICSQEKSLRSAYDCPPLLSSPPSPQNAWGWKLSLYPGKSWEQFQKIFVGHWHVLKRGASILKICHQLFLPLFSLLNKNHQTQLVLWLKPTTCVLLLLAHGLWSRCLQLTKDDLN